MRRSAVSAAMTAMAAPAEPPPARFSELTLVGRGAYGTVYAAVDSDLGDQRVAVKHIKDVFQCPLTSKRMLREIRVHRLLQREAPEAAVRLLGAVVPPDKFNDVFLVLELMHCTLHTACHNADGGVTDEQARYLAQHLLKAVRDMHACGIVHRDIKPQNVLVNADCTLRLCDFGMARSVHSQDTLLWSDYVTTRWYRPPEMFVRLGVPYTQASDMWSVGCVIAELLLCGKALFPGRNAEHQLSLIEAVLGPPPTGYFDKGHTTATRSEDVLDLLDCRLSAAPPGARSLLRGMLKYNPAERLTAEQAVRHDFFFSEDEMSPLPSPATSPATSTSPPAHQRRVSTSQGGTLFDFDRLHLSNLQMRELLQSELLDLAREGREAQMAREALAAQESHVT